MVHSREGFVAEYLITPLEEIFFLGKTTVQEWKAVPFILDPYAMDVLFYLFYGVIDSMPETFPVRSVVETQIVYDC